VRLDRARELAAQLQAAIEWLAECTDAQDEAHAEYADATETATAPLEAALSAVRAQLAQKRAAAAAARHLPGQTGA
jgi:hypothetical protein